MGGRRKDKRLDSVICFRVSKEQKEILQLIADYSGMELSELFRSIALALVLAFKTGIPVKVPVVREEGESDEDRLHVPEKAEG